MLNSLKTMLGVSLLALIGVWMGCSNDTSPVASYSASKSHTGDVSPSPTDPPSPTDSEDGDLTDTGSQVVAIPDTNLANAIKLALQRLPEFGTGGPEPALTATNLAKLKTLYTSRQGISDLTGLEYATGLDTLDMRWDDIEDLSPLAGLTGLKYLELLRNDIEDIRPLAGLENLERLGIGGNRDIDLSRDIGVLAGLTKLKHFRINDFGLGDSGLETLAHNLPGLENLNISSNGNITDFSPLTCLLPTLKTLRLRGMHRLYQINADAPGDDLRVPADDQPTLRYLAARGVTIRWD